MPGAKIVHPQVLGGQGRPVSSTTLSSVVWGARPRPRVMCEVGQRAPRPWGTLRWASTTPKLTLLCCRNDPPRDVALEGPHARPPGRARIHHWPEGDRGCRGNAIEPLSQCVELVCSIPGIPQYGSLFSVLEGHMGRGGRRRPRSSSTRRRRARTRACAPPPYRMRAAKLGT